MDGDGRLAYLCRGNQIEKAYEQLYVPIPRPPTLRQGGAESAIKEEMKRVGGRVLLAYGGGSLRRTGLYDKVVDWLHECGKTVVDFGGILPNPAYDKVQQGARLVRDEGIDFILAVGGGSVIDCCKIIAAQARLDEDIWEMQYARHQYPTEFVPTGAVVTTSGTGAEQNNGAVITHTAKKLKQPQAVGGQHVLGPQAAQTGKHRAAARPGHGGEGTRFYNTI